FDGSGRASIWVTNFPGELHSLHRNTGREVFHHATRASGVAALGQSYVGFGTAFTDLDNDGWEDIAIATGHVLQHPVLGAEVKQKPVLLRNIEHEGKRYFVIATERGGPYFRKPEYGRGLAAGDLDNDGWPDLVVSHTNTPGAVLRNVGAESGAARWVGVKLVGKGNRDVVGSTISLDTGTRTQTRFSKGGGSYLSHNDSRAHFGLGPDGAVRRVRVRWSWGETQTWEGVEPGAYWELREGEPAAKRVPNPGG
ncbi:MAG TPA: CRTAC1 family protein, partial [Gemmataceae bacterium]|nr:CRTAC1 family protein [Gemmataceae bacterium]